MSEDIEKQQDTVNVLHVDDVKIVHDGTSSSPTGEVVKPPHTSVTYTNYLCYYYAGLSSDDPALKRRSQYIIYGHIIGFSILVIGVILTFTVIIPSIMQDIVNNSNLHILSAAIVNPTNYSFTSSVLSKFTNVGAIGADVQMNTLTISWDGNGGGDMLKLTRANKLHVENNAQTTMTSLATVYDMEAFSNFNSYLVHNEEAQWNIDGTADVTFLITSTINFHKTVTLQGANNFSIPPQIHSTDVMNGSTYSLFIKSNVTMFSQSNVQLTNEGQILNFDLELNGIPIGTGSIPNYQMIEGAYSTLAYLNLTYSNDEEYQQICYLMGNYSCGFATNATMKNFYLSPSLIWLAPALGSVTMKSTLPGCQDTLVKLVYLFTSKNLLSLDYELVLYNPQPVNLTLTSITGQISYQGTPIATVDNTGIHIVIPPYSIITTDKMKSSSITSPAAVAAFNQLTSAGHGQVDLDNVIIGNFSEFKGNFIYRQNNVTLIVIPPK